MMTRSQQNSTAAMLINKLGLLKNKAIIVSGICFGRTESIRELTDTEVGYLIEYLNNEQRKKNGDNDAANRQRRKIIALAHQLHWHLPGTLNIDMQRVNDWCIKYGYLHKKLNSYTEKELPTLVTAFTNMYNAEIKKLTV